MKKIFLFIVIFITTVGSASAQLTKTAGMSLDYGTYAEGFGLGFRYQQLLNDHFRLAPNFTYYLKSNDKSGWNVNVDMHYLIPTENEKATLYPILGLNMLSVKYHSGIRDGLSKNGYGGNLGFGASYALLKHFSFFGEMKYALVSGTDQLSIGIGLDYNF